MSNDEVRAKVYRKVVSIGMSRCDICEAMRAECFEVAAGFFGSRAVYLCPRCMRVMTQMVENGETT